MNFENRESRIEKKLTPSCNFNQALKSPKAPISNISCRFIIFKDLTTSTTAVKNRFSDNKVSNLSGIDRSESLSNRKKKPEKSQLGLVNKSSSMILTSHPVSSPSPLNDSFYCTFQLNLLYLWHPISL